MALATRPKPSSHYKKRQAGHHRHSKHYLKAYWPYLPMLLIVVVGLAINSLWASSQHVLGTASDFSSLSFLKFTNENRVSNNEQPLTLSTELTAAAQAKATDMVENNYWSHTSPSGKTPWDFINAAGYTYQLAGENLAFGFNNASETINGWMNSPEHRANILTANYTNVGFGVANSPNYQGHGPETVIVAEYAEPAPAAAIISFTVPEHTVASPAVKPGSLELSAQPVSRIQLLTGGQAIWSALVLSALAGAAFMLLIVRYGLRLKYAVKTSEAFIVHHPLLDIAMVFIATAGFVLTRTSGIIR